MVKIVFLLLLIAICVALSYAGLWMEWRNRACRSHPIGKSYKAATSVQCGTITRPCGWLSYSPASWRQAALMAGPQTWRERIMLQIFATAVGELQRTFSDAFNPYRPELHYM